MNENESRIKAKIREAVTRVVEGRRGEIEENSWEREAYDLVDFSDVDLSELALLAVHAEVRSQRRTRSVERRDTDMNGQLWTDSYLDSLMTVAPGIDIKARDAVDAVHQRKREQQIQNLRRQNAAFERDEQRRDELRPLQSKDPNLTTEDALRQLGKLPGQDGEKWTHS